MNTTELLTGKTGNAVTRWIRSLGKKRFHTNISSPVNELERHTHTLSGKQADMELWRIFHSTQDYVEDSCLATNIRVISHTDPVLLQRIIQSVRDEGFERGYWKDRLHHSEDLNHNSPAKLEEELSAFRTSLDVNVMLRHVANHGIIIDWQSPRLYQATVSVLLNDGNVKTPSSELVQALALIAYIKAQPNAVPWKQGPNKTSDIYNSLAADASYIVDHLEQVTLLLPDLISRCTHDWSIIDMLLNSNVQALREGEL